MTSSILKSLNIKKPKGFYTYNWDKFAITVDSESKHNDTGKFVLAFLL